MEWQINENEVKTLIKLDNLRQLLNKNNVDGLLVTNEYNRRYMTGFTGTAGVVLITNDEALLITDFRYITQATNQAEGFHIIEHKKTMEEEITNQINRLGIKRLGFEENDVTYGKFSEYNASFGCELIPTKQLVEQLRLIKTNEELKILKDAAAIADDAFEYILTLIKPGRSEIEIANELEFYMRKQGAISSSFDIIVASGYRSALPHGVASDKKIESGELITLDFGALYKGYCSDITRTVAVGEISNQLKEIYNVVLKAQEKGVAEIKSMMTGKEADAIPRSYITEKGYGQYFGHSTGHGIGLEVHEGPSLSPRYTTRLEPNMVVTVEPGIYIPEVGGCRIEDDIVLTETGNTRLTHARKELIHI